MLVSHAAIEAPLCYFVARCLKMNSAEPLIRFVLAKGRLPTRSARRYRGGDCRCGCKWGPNHRTFPYVCRVVGVDPPTDFQYYQMTPCPSIPNQLARLQRREP